MTGGGEGRLEHLRLVRTETAGRRRPESPRPRGGVSYADRQGHARDVADEATAAVVEHLQRPPVMGIDPRLILVFETNALLEPDVFRPAQLQILDSSTGSAVVAFASDPQLTGFLTRLQEYRQGVPPGRRTARFEGFYDAIDGIRRYGPEDRFTARMLEALDAASADAVLLADVECWYPDTRAAAESWVEEVERATTSDGGEVIDRYINPAAALALVRVSGQAATILALGDLDVVASIDAIPEPPVWTYQAVQYSVDELPTLMAPESDAPLVAVVDSGVRAAHPILAGAVHDAIALSGLGDGADRHGHGTAVAGIVVRGPLEAALATGVADNPPCRVLSIRVLDQNNNFPVGITWPHELESAVRYAAAEGARVVNISIGDPGTPYRGARSTPVAAVLDSLAKELKLVIVVSAGNVPLARYSMNCADISSDYPDAVLDEQDCAIIDPAPAALALTVGAVVSKETPGSVGRRPIGQRGWPSPFSRRGPGIGGSLKPELVAPGGTYAVEANGDIVDDDELGCIVADGTGSAGAVLRVEKGTSFAAPMASRAAAAVLQQYPAFGPNLVRALVLQGASDDLPSFLPSRPNVGERGLLSLCRQLIGYGQVRLDESVRSGPGRTVLVAEDDIGIDGVHVYEVPIPSTFFETGGARGITVTLAYDPDTRARRLDYLSSRMKFEVVRGLTPGRVSELFLASPDDDDAEGDNAGGGGNGNPVRLSDLSSVQRLQLEPATRPRSAGANQLGRKTFHQRLRKADGEVFLVVVQNTNRWSPSGGRQPYGLAVTLWQDRADVDLYADLQARIRAEARVELEVRT